MVEPWQFHAIGICLVVNFVWPFLLGFSFAAVRPWQYGILLNRNTMRFGEDPPHTYGMGRDDAGREFVGLGQELVHFPKTLRRMKMNNESDADTGPVEARARDGLVISLSLSLQYLLNGEPQNLEALYRTFDGAQHTFYIKYVRSVTRDIVSDFRVRELWENRTDIARAMQNALNETFAANYASVYRFQLLDMRIPDRVQAALENTAIESQRVLEAVNNRTVQYVRGQTIYKEAEKSVQILQIDAQATANATLLNATAQASSVALAKQADSNSLPVVSTNLNLTNHDLLSFLWMDAMRSSSVSSVVLGVPRPANISVA